MKTAVAIIGLAGLVISLFGCDLKRIEKLEEGVATEADVRQQFGEPQDTTPILTEAGRSSIADNLRARSRT